MPAWTAAQRDVLATAIAQGVLTVHHEGRSVTYQSLDAMRALLAEMDRQLDGPPTTRFAAFRKGT